MLVAVRCKWMAVERAVVHAPSKLVWFVYLHAIFRQFMTFEIAFVATAHYVFSLHKLSTNETYPFGFAVGFSRFWCVSFVDINQNGAQKNAEREQRASIICVSCTCQPINFQSELRSQSYLLMKGRYKYWFFFCSLLSLAARYVSLPCQHSNQNNLKSRHILHGFIFSLVDWEHNFHLSTCMSLLFVYVCVCVVDFFWTFSIVLWCIKWLDI